MMVYGGKNLIKKLINKKTVIAVVDIEIAERTDNKITLQDYREVELGIGGTRKTEFKEDVNFKFYQSRVLIISENSHMKSSETIKDFSKQFISSIVATI